MDIIKNKLNRICDSFNCSKFGFPANQEAFLQKFDEIEKSKKEAESVIIIPPYLKNNLIIYIINNSWLE